MQTQNITEQRLPITTWNKQGVNTLDITVTKNQALSGITVKEQMPTGVIAQLGINNALLAEVDANMQLANAKSDMVVVGTGIKTWMQQNSNFARTIEVPANIAPSQPIKLAFLGNQTGAILNDNLLFVARANSTSTIIVEYDSEQELHHTGVMLVHAEANAVVNIIKVQQLSTNSVHNDYVFEYAEESANITHTQIELGSNHANASLHVSLTGNNSRHLGNLLYLADGERKVDISARVDMIGKQSDGHFVAKGVMLERSKKTLRDTLNFVAGAKGSKGKEEEHVLMLSDKVTNISVPVLLCGEEDVEGEHAATSGKPEERVMFYLLSRGLSERDAKKLLAYGAFASVLETVQDTTIKQKVLTKLEQAVEKGV